MENQTKKIMVEKGFYEKNGKQFDCYFIKGNVRGLDVVAAVKPPDVGGYKVLDIVFDDALEAELVITPFEIKDDHGKVVKGNTYKVVSYDEDGTEYECPIKPANQCDKSFLKMILR